MENKFVRAAIPALFIHMCIGSVYCWSLLKGQIAVDMGVGVPQIEMAFSLAIFFLGMSAAFGGRLVEKNVNFTSFLSMVCFVSGLCLASYAVTIQSLPLLFASYGALMGVGLGIGYLSPVKTLMLWFKDSPGLATGIAISGFGLSKVIFSPIIEGLLSVYDSSTTLLIMAGISVLPMTLAAILIRKPKHWIEATHKFCIKEAFRIVFNPDYIKIWLMFFINITCGLALIAFEKPIGLYVGFSSIALLSSLTAVFNTAGRFCYATGSDFLTRKAFIYGIIFLTSLACCFASYALMLPMVIVVALMVVNAGYGGGFSTLPIILKETFGMEKISMIHGFALSAWAWAGLSGNQLSSYLINIKGYGYEVLFGVLGVLYAISFVISLSLMRSHHKMRAKQMVHELKVR
ncbi:MAG: OFA family MFS transporter [Burkholderiaceae bacterium]|nr:OFA family MFS transporter [Burkholderiaceae bacterium]